MRKNRSGVAGEDLPIGFCFPAARIAAATALADRRARVRAHEPPQFLRNGERDQEVGARHELFQLLVEPLLGLVPLTLRAMPVAARLRHHVIAATRIATVQSRAEFAGAASFQRLHDTELVAAHAIGELAAIRRAVLAKDVADRRRRGAGRAVCRGGRCDSELIFTHGSPADRS
jgi:hypothetical protein